MSESTTHDSQCPRCLQPNLEEYRPLKGTISGPGDVCVLDDSPTVPIYRILGQPLGSRGNHSTPGPLSGNSAVSEDQIYYPRPGIIIDIGRTNGCFRYNVCLMGTFVGATDLDSLPRILQLFCVRVYTHPWTQPPLLDVPHVHTTPEWPLAEEGVHCQWLLAFCYDTSKFKGRWQNRRSAAPRSSFFQMNEDLEKVVELCQKRMRDWEEFVQQDPEAVNGCFKEFKKATKKSAREKQEKRRVSTSAEVHLRPKTCMIVNVDEDTGSLEPILCDRQSHEHPTHAERQPSRA
ncbi:hypothetical protein FKP32DRAFT_1588601 [Trametes sanguinea]|nr:hypothetical protein FKP32DRAFT_1588601 [Trametes sanguinea]